MRSKWVGFSSEIRREICGLVEIGILSRMHSSQSPSGAIATNKSVNCKALCIERSRQGSLNPPDADGVPIVLLLREVEHKAQRKL
jgi:hypothetical protein